MAMLRRAIPEDGPAVRDLVFAILRSFDIEPDPEHLDADVVAFGATGGRTPWPAEWVAIVSDKIVGCVALTERGPGVAYLSKLFVDENQRGRGIGRALLQAAVDEARARGCRRVELRTRARFVAACALYEATGWRRGPDPPQTGGPDRTYSLLLTPSAPSAT